MNNVISHNTRETTTKKFETSQKYAWSDKSIVFYYDNRHQRKSSFYLTYQARSCILILSSLYN